MKSAFLGDDGELLRFIGEKAKVGTDGLQGQQQQEGRGKELIDLALVSPLRKSENKRCYVEIKMFKKREKERETLIPFPSPCSGYPRGRTRFLQERSSDTTGYGYERGCVYVYGRDYG